MSGFMAQHAGQLRPFVIDCDTGRDDALAILFALQRQLPLLGMIASYGNSSLAQVVENNARLLSLADRDDVPLFAGAQAPSQAHLAVQTMLLPRQTHSGNGLCNLLLPPAKRALPIPDGIRRWAQQLQAWAAQHGALDYYILGPATNFAALCQALGGDLSHSIGRVTMLGGTFAPLWAERGADFNCLCDPFAVQHMLMSGIVPRFVPLNVTWPIALTVPDIQLLQPTSPIGAFVHALMLAHCEHFAPEPIFRLHDPSVLVAALHSQAFVAETLMMPCVEGEPDFARLCKVVAGAPAEIYQPAADFTAQARTELLAALDLVVR
jgi:purine nucleosidase